MKTVTYYFEELPPDDATGQVATQCTGVHIDYGDGTASWIAPGELDKTTPKDSPYTWREIADRALGDSAELPKLVRKAQPVAPNVGDFLSGVVASVNDTLAKPNANGG